VSQTSTGVWFKKVVFESFTVRSTTRTLITDKNDHSAFTAIISYTTVQLYESNSNELIEYTGWSNLYVINNNILCRMSLAGSQRATLLVLLANKSSLRSTTVERLDADSESV
jgi:hypothetical protein